MQRVKQKLVRIFDFSTSSQVALTIFLEIMLGLFITVLTLGIFLKLTDNIIDKEIIFFDTAIMQLVYLFRSEELTSVMKFVTSLGGELFIGTSILLTIFFLYLKNHKKDMLLFSFILFFGIGLNFLLKEVFQRPRPEFFPLIHEATYSFPSGHAMNSFIFYTCLSFFIFRKMRNNQLKIILMCLSALLIFFVGISRIYLGVHYPSDVVGGYIAGLSWFVVVLLFEKTLYFRHLFKQFEFEKKY